MIKQNDTHVANVKTASVKTASKINNGALQEATLIATLWLIDDDAALRLVLSDTFTDANLNVVIFTQAQAAWTRLNDILAQQEPISQLPDVILTDIRMPMMDGLSFSDWVHQHFPTIPIVIMTAHSDITSAINSYQAGAFEYLPKPFDLDDAVATIYKAIDYHPNRQSINDTHETPHLANVDKTTDNPKPRLADNVSTSEMTANKAINSKAIKKAQPKKAHAKPDNDRNKPHHKSDPNSNAPSNSAINNNPSGIIGQSQAMQTVFRAIGRLAHSPITVLITGESGTGKELVASALHQHSPRAEQPFIALNMAAIPHDLIESELFGHEKGAFTGATTQRQGRFEQADGGTLFLDEIGDMPFSTQTRLLRVLANGEFYRVGGQQPVKVNVRIIAATHQNLEHLVQQGKFREDLFYRLNVIRIPLPPLRARPDDIPALTHYFMQHAAKQLATEPKQLHPQALRLMQAFDWRGNVRQLENVCLWLTVMTTGDIIMSEDLPPELLTTVPTSKTPNIDKQSEHQAINTDTSVNTDLSTSVNTGTGVHTEISPDNEAPLHKASFTPPPTHTAHEVWQHALKDWAQHTLHSGKSDILQTATPEFERILLTEALRYTGGKKIEAAKLLGWGRNTLTRKLQQLDISL